MFESKREREEFKTGMNKNTFQSFLFFGLLGHVEAVAHISQPLETNVEVPMKAVSSKAE